MYLDMATIFVKAGNGGDGVVSFHTEKYVDAGGPDGGDGGNGGSIVFKVQDNTSTLVDFQYAKHFRAEDGGKGSSKNCRGKNGKDLVITVPRGTIIKDKATGKIVADMFYKDSEFVFLKGGLGGKGNARFATPQRKAPKFCQTGEKTEERELLLELKTIADVGLVGFPNVGKSTLLSVVSSAKPKIANYHFTTLSPNLGVVKYYDDSFCIADIPGLIEGASEGAGLGFHFLRHIERVRLILHIVDISGSEGRDPYEDYEKINYELKNYSEKLSNLPQIVCANKCDLVEDESQIEEFEKKIGQKVIRLSAISKTGTQELMKLVSEKLKDLPQTEPVKTEVLSFEKDANQFTITVDEYGVYYVTGGLVDMLIRNVILDDFESNQYFQRTLKEKGVFKALRKAGCKNKDIVSVGDVEFEYQDENYDRYQDSKKEDEEYE